MMKCPNCQSLNTIIKDSRPNEYETRRRRRYECNECGFRFTTYEVYQKQYEDLIEQYVIDAVRTKQIIEKVEELMKEVKR